MSPFGLSTGNTSREYLLQALPLRRLAGAQPRALQQALVGRELDIDQIGYGHHVVVAAGP